ncbi:hypothetical protein V6Z12_D11G138600 [Gossypium hirsutum]
MAQIEYAINIGGSKGKLIMPFQNAAQQHGLKCQRKGEGFSLLRFFLNSTPVAAAMSPPKLHRRWRSEEMDPCKHWIKVRGLCEGDVRDI